MTTLEEAEAARAQNSTLLLRLGAHAIEVGKVLLSGKQDFVVIASFERRPNDVPKKIPVAIKNAVKEVALKVRIAPQFRPE
jgi:acyl-CoA thioesterase FadM